VRRKDGIRHTADIVVACGERGSDKEIIVNKKSADEGGFFYLTHKKNL